MGNPAHLLNCPPAGMEHSHGVPLTESPGDRKDASADQMGKKG
jgi:hypothetical protein